MPGHPDGQSYALWRGNAILTAIETVTIASPFAFDATVTNFASLMVHVQTAAGNGGDITAAFYDDAGHTKFAGQFSWQPWACDLQVTIPILGNFLHFTITTPNAGNQVFTCYLAPSNVVVTRPVYTAGFNQVAAFGVSVGAGATVQLQFPDIAAGIVYLAVSFGDATAKLQFEVDELDHSGNGLDALIQPQTSQFPVYALTACGERCLNFKIINTDGAAAHTINYHVKILSQ